MEENAMWLAFFDENWITFFNDDIYKNIVFIGTPDNIVSLLEKIIRPVLVYIFLVVALRIFGKRELAQLNPFDLIVLLTLSNTLQNAIIGADNSISGGMIGAVTLLSFNYVVVRFLFKHRRLDQIVAGKPSNLIHKGRVNRKEMAKELITESELLAIVHRQGFGKLDDIDTCVLDENGTFYVEAKDPPEHIKRHNEILQKIEELNKQINELQKKTA
jgi:uncharacterized membrane protein YcaP (DUF421 family)